MSENQQKNSTVQPTEQAHGNALGAFIKKARQDVGMTLREVEEATHKEVSNGYLSQLEGGKIGKPSPHVLYTLANVLSADYESLMQRAGYILPGKRRTDSNKQGRTDTFSIDSLTQEEETQLLEFLSFLRSKKK